MSKLHIANAFFEWELETEPKMSLNEAFQQHPIFRQLQFLPVLYAEKDAGILLSDLPMPNYWKLLRAKGISIPAHFLLENTQFSPYTEIESWGPSQLIAQWAKHHHLNYAIPNWTLVKEVNSKRFSFTNSPKLPHATLLSTESQAKQWVLSFPGKKVLKTCFGVSGKGHLIISEDTSSAWGKILSFLVKEWKKELPVIAEPWVERKLDFSTQWYIDPDQTLSYRGATICNNDDRGQYRYSIVGDEQVLFQGYLHFLNEHKQIVAPILQSIAKRGFFGNLGVDAMLYASPENPDIELLHPIVEINARKTMGWAALQFQRQYFAKEIVRFQYASNDHGYLPDCVESKQGKKILFPRNLTAEQMLFTIKSHSR